MVVRSHLTHPLTLGTDWLECADVFTTHRKVECLYYSQVTRGCLKLTLGRRRQHLAWKRNTASCWSQRAAENLFSRQLIITSWQGDMTKLWNRPRPIFIGRASGGMWEPGGYPRSAFGNYLAWRSHLTILALDFIGPLHRNAQEYRFVLVLVNYAV